MRRRAGKRDGGKQTNLRINFRKWKKSKSDFFEHRKRKSEETNWKRLCRDFFGKKTKKKMRNKLKVWVRIANFNQISSTFLAPNKSAKCQTGNAKSFFPFFHVFEFCKKTLLKNIHFDDLFQNSTKRRPSIFEFGQSARASSTTSHGRTFVASGKWLLLN